MARFQAYLYRLGITLWNYHGTGKRGIWSLVEKFLAAFTSFLYSRDRLDRLGLFPLERLAVCFWFFSAAGWEHVRPVASPFQPDHPLPFIEPSFLLATAAGIIFCLPLSSVWNRFRADLEKRNSMLYFAIQPLEDILLVTLFVFGLAALISGTFAPNLYAKF